jgi:hypothetical protein
VSPINGATVSLPFTFDWSDVANPQIPGYDLDVDDEPNFLGTFGVLLVQNISRSDYTLVSDLAPGTYFWRVRALHGSVAGPWSAGGSFRVVASPPTPPGLGLFWMITEPGSVMGGASTQARVTLNGPAPAGGATIRIASDMPHAEVPQNVFIPAGATDATVSNITTIPVSGAVIGNLRAAYGTSWQQSSLGLWQILFSLSLNANSVVGGSSVTGTVTLQRPAPVGGIDVSLVSNDTSLARPPAHVIVPEGATSASFPIVTSPVAIPTQIVIDTGTAYDGYRAPETWLILRPAGSPAPAPAISSVTLASSSILGGGSTTGTVTLTRPAPAGGASVWVNGSMEGDVVTPGGSVTIPAGGTSATFPIVAPAVNFSRWVLIQASYGNGAGMHGAVLRIDPSLPATPGVLAMTIDPVSTIGGGSVRGTVGLATPAPAGGATVFLSSDNPAARVPASVSIPAGNSATTFTVATSVVTGFNSATITASAGSTSKSAFLSVFPDPNPPPPPPPPSAAAVDLALSGVPSSIRRGQTFTATGAVSNAGGSTASGYSVLIGFNPSNAIRLQSPQSATQSVAAIAPGGSRNVSWQLRGDRTGTATLTMTLRDSSGATVRTASRTVTITN